MCLWFRQVLQDSRELELDDAQKNTSWGNEDKVAQIESCLTIWIMQIEKASLLEIGFKVNLWMLKSQYEISKNFSGV